MMIRGLKDPSGKRVFERNFALYLGELAASAGQPAKVDIGELRKAITEMSGDVGPAEDRLKAQLALAELEMQSGKLSEASKAIAEIKSVDGKGEWEDSRLDQMLVESEVQRSMGYLRDAEKLLQQEIAEAHGKGYVYSDLKGEIELCVLEHSRTHDPKDRERMEAIERQAAQYGYKTLVRQAAAPLF
jgi:hypothetical protein